MLLAILILASILAITFSLTTILFIEVKNAADLQRTEGAIYGATGVGEQALFNLSRQACPNNDCYTAQFNNSVTLVGPPTLVASSTPIIFDKIPPNSSFTTTTKKYDFCGVNSSSAGCGYGKITLNYSSANTDTADRLYAYMCEWDQNLFVISSTDDQLYGTTNTYSTPPCSATSTPASSSQCYWLVPGIANSCQSGGAVYLSGSTNNSVTWRLNSNKQQQLILENRSSTHSLYFSLSTFAGDETTPLGLPYVGRTGITVNTISGSVGRKIQVTVPAYTSSSSTPP